MKRSVLSLIFAALALNSAQIRDLASVVGVRDNQLIGYGLVVGLNGSGDGSSSKFTIQSISNMLQTVNVKVSASDIKSKNTAAVIVTAKLPPFARQGDKLDIMISSIGDAKSLMGGTLLMTALKGVDGDIYALAQGAVALGGQVERRGGNHPTVATISGGALVEREAGYDLSSLEFVNLSLNDSSFETASKMQNAINSRFEGAATAIDPRTIRLKKPANSTMVSFLAGVLDLDMDYKAAPRLIIDERTGTIVSGVDISVDPVVISHGNITIKIDPQSYAQSEPDKTILDLGDQTMINTQTSTLNIGAQKTTIANITRALNKLGATPKQIIAILENLKRVGAIHAPLEII